MSSIITSNISDGTTSVGTGYVVNGSAKAWLRFIQSTQAVQGSMNISSVTDSSTGQYVVNFANAFDAADNYGYSASGRGGGAIKYGAFFDDGVGDTASSFPVIVGEGANEYDATSSTSFYGDLA